MQRNIEKVYDPTKVEARWYQYWLDRNFFHADPNSEKKPYTIVIPPPNITGILTMGHVLNNTLQDILIRWKRMQGYETLWLPGTDHAGIATQNVVEKDLAHRGLTRHDLGREKFVQKVWQWKEKHGSTIIQQLKTLGCSCDWQRERFTMDEGLSRAVQEVFVRLYEKGLIYRGKYIINWCPRCETALSDEESIHRDEKGSLWYIKYPIKGKDDTITVGTTRPETMLGDTAVAVHPKDPRYTHLIGRTLVLPILGREIPVIADDEFVDPKFGTGAVKVTPAHDPNDFLIGQKHNLSQIIVMNEDGTMNEEAGPKYVGMDRFACRKALVKDLKSRGLLEKIESYTHSVGHCQRCDTVIEPYLSDQWFVRMKPLAKPAIEAVKSERLRFYPERWTKVYLNWLENIRDWCISRQLWWGHRIPVWYCECGYQMVERNAPKHCRKCGSDKITQDEDVLDTWFSSWLWPFSTLGWPEQTPELEKFYPTDTLVTAPDIIFFWVARMVMAGYEFMGECPFSDVYFTSMVRDFQGRKMSKSLGNSPDPTEVMDTYGADALRFTMAILAPVGQDILYSNEKVEIGRNFANKIWNAFRFLAMNLEEDHQAEIGELLQENHGQVELADRWILSRYNATVKQVTESLQNFKMNEAADSLYSFFWHDYCDWYLEMIKPRLYQPESKYVAFGFAFFIIKGFLKLLHPFMPFITEEIWQRLGNKGGQDSIVVAEWPQWDENQMDENTEQNMSLIQEVIRAIRNIRGEMNVPPTRKADVYIKGRDVKLMGVLRENEHYVRNLATAEKLILDQKLKKPKLSASAVVRGLEIFVPLEGLIDIEKEKSRLNKEKGRIERQLEILNQKLNSEQFLKKAPKEVIEKERKKKQDFEITLDKLHNNLASLRE